MSQEGLLRRLAWELWFDVRRAAWHTVVNVVAASPLLPRPARFGLYRLAGLDVHTLNISPRVTFTHGNISIGRHTFLNLDVFVEGEPVRIGERCQISVRAMLATTYHGTDDRGVARHGFERRGIEIGDDCFIGAHVVVLPGVRIASGTTVAAGAVVTKDIDEPGLYGGVPATLIRPTAGSRGS